MSPSPRLGPALLGLLLFLGSARGESRRRSPALGLGSARGPGLLEEGRQQLSMVRELAEQDGYGWCWKEALGRVDRGCRQLDEEQQSRIALAFAHCHLQRSGKSFPPCGESSTVLACTQDMDSVAFGAYTEFFTHAHSICYYLQNEIWQQEAEETIERLTVNSESVARQLETTNQMAKEMIDAQNATLRTQGVRQVFREMQESTTEQRLIFAEIFQRLSYLHQFVMVESTAFYSILYNLLAFAVAVLLTSTPRTAGARLILFMLICFTVYLERLVYSSQMGPSDSSFEYTERIYSRIWLLRKLMVISGVLVLVYFGATYQDVGKQSLEVLRSLRETQSSLQRMIEEAEKIIRPPLLQPAEGQWKEGRLKEVDSGFGDTRMGSEESLSSGTALDLEFAAFPTSTPKKTAAPPRSPSRSAARRRIARPSDVSVYNILVSESPSKYNLRSRKSPGRLPPILG
ncbi:uncharacterized protein [Heptranchias perlo]|uniref:uncharacterized protein isoform X2 n=1 Tax=Heptranchias perlo TaxID=212740 RepID=UPI003559A0C5